MTLLLGIVLFGFIISTLITSALLLAPLESLTWWAGWNKRHPKARDIKLELTPEGDEKEHYFVFLDGIAKASNKNYDNVEALLEELRQLPNSAVIGDIIPYATTGVPLTRRRPLSSFWRFLLRLKKEDEANPFAFLINIRNLFQVLVSADKRYSAVYHAASARLIIKRLLEHGYQPGSGKVIHLIGYSGGAQVAVGVSPFLKESLRAPVDLISLGGVISADPGLNDLRYIYHIAGKSDRVEQLGAFIFPGRWAIFMSSSWNRAKRKGKFTYIPIPACKHDGDGGYLDENCKLPSGETHMAFTARLMKEIALDANAIHSARQKRGFYIYLYDPLHLESGSVAPALSS